MSEKLRANGEVLVLLAEDSDDDAFLFERSLQGHPHLKMIGRARNGEEVIRYLDGASQSPGGEKQPWPAVLVLDLKMPGVDGFGVLKWLQGQSERPKVIVFTSSEAPADCERALALGADAFQTKCDKPARLLEVIDSLGWTPSPQD